MSWSGPWRRATEAVADSGVPRFDVGDLGGPGRWFIGQRVGDGGAVVAATVESGEVQIVGAGLVADGCGDGV